jgi:hypothetical protein
MLGNLRYQTSRNFTLISMKTWLVVLVGLVSPFSLFGQTDSSASGTVTTKDGQPIAGVTVSGTRTCCPAKREQVTTDHCEIPYPRRP